MAQKGSPTFRIGTYGKGFFFWAMFLVVTIFWYTAILLAALKVRITREDHLGKPFHRIAAGWSRTILMLTPGWGVKVFDAKNLPSSDRPVVIVANHESMSDIWALYHLGMQFRWLAKESVFRLPIVGHSMRLAGYVPIRRGDKDSHSAALDQSAVILRQGISMFFFPEGTRSQDGSIKKFKVGAFKLAKDCDVDILPLALCGAGELIPKGSFWPGASLVKVKVLPVTKLQSDDLEEEASRIRQLIVTAHQELSSTSEGRS